MAQMVLTLIPSIDSSDRTQRRMAATMMKMPEQRRMPMASFRTRGSWTFQSSGNGMQTMAKSVLLLLLVTGGSEDVKTEQRTSC